MLEILHTPAPGVDDKHNYIEILGNLLSQYNVVAISQVIDEWQQNIGDRDTHVKSLAREYIGEITTSSNYEAPTRSEKAGHTYVIHTFGPLSTVLLERLMCFGMTALPNIIYGLEYELESWSQEITNWDSIVAGWFRFKLEDASLLDLIKKVGLLGWTSDGHLTFGLLKEKAFNEVLPLLQKIATKNGWNLIVNGAEFLDASRDGIMCNT